MKRLKLLRFFYSEYFLKELVLMVLVIILSVSMLSTLSYYMHTIKTRENIINTIQKPTLFFSPHERIIDFSVHHDNSNAIKNAWEIYNRELGSSSEYISIGTTLQNTCKIGIGNTLENVLMIIYNDAIINNTEFELKAGQWFNDSNTNENIPVILGSKWMDIYNIGDKIKLYIPNNTLEKEFNAEISGFLNDDNWYFRLNGGGIVNLNSIIQYDWKKTVCIISKSLLSGYIDNDNDDAGRLLFFDSNKELIKWKQENEERLLKFGNIYTLQQLYNNQKDFDWGRTKRNILTFIFVMILSIFGLGGYNYLLVINSMKTLGILYAYGLSRSKAVIYCLVSKIILVIVPSITSVYLSKFFITYKADMLLNVGSVFIIIFLLSTVSLLSISTINRVEIINNLSKGD